MNAGKYFLSICCPLVGIWVVKYQYDTVFWLYFIVKIFATLYSYAWDLYMDWGIIRTKNPSKYGLREKITFSKYFYYWAAVSNLFLRFIWIIFIWRNFYIEEKDVDISKHFQI